MPDLVLGSNILSTRLDDKVGLADTALLCMAGTVACQLEALSNLKRVATESRVAIGAVTSRSEIASRNDWRFFIKDIPDTETDFKAVEEL